MTVIDYELEYPLIYLNLVYVKDRIFYLGEDMQITLSDKRVILIPKGFETDLSSIPQIFWGVFKPFDKGLLGDLIHDYFWVEKISETLYFDNAYVAQKFADEAVIYGFGHSGNLYESLSDSLFYQDASLTTLAVDGFYAQGDFSGVVDTKYLLSGVNQY